MQPLYDKIFFTNLLRILAERDMSINELHALSGVSSSIISDITRGQGNPTINTMSAISVAIGMPLPELLKPTEPELYQQLIELGGLYNTPSLPSGFEYVGAILAPFQAHQVREWDLVNRKKLRKILKQSKS